ncbi:MAG: DEAD/DEAH box helicase, partial [Verrucomicrobiaceae bacterium]
MKQATPTRVIGYVLEGYQRYYDSAFWMRDEGIMAERRALLSTPGVMAQEPLLEAVPQYPSVEDIADACRRAGLSEETAIRLGDVVFGASKGVMLRQHQAASLVTAIAGNKAGHRNVVVTSGTGSGKTESFLLPLLATLLEERREGIGQGGPHAWWALELGRDAKQWHHLRSKISNGPTPAIRAMVLYPTNALVEDQISRLRQAASRARAIHGQPLFYFGRYTGATLGGTFLPPAELDASARGRINEVGREVRQVQKEAKQLRDTMESRGESQSKILEACSQFQDPLSGEMLTRWDMITSPPDIMITNMSMMNVMLMRDVEAPLFQKTKDWLESDPTNVFTLVVDELHSYRGTQGTEVALVVRNMLDRLGLAPDSKQLRCIATSASINGDEGKDYLQEFFGVDGASFTILPGSPRVFDHPLPVETDAIASEADALLGDSTSEAGLAANRVAQAFSPREALATACKVVGTTD